MGLVLCLIGFAAAYAVVMFIGSWITVSALDWGDPKFGDTAGNLWFVGQILPIVVTIATLSAFFGARTYQEWLRRRLGFALAVGSGTGALTAAAFFALSAAWMAAARVLPELLVGVLLFGLRILIFAVPATVAYVFIGYVRRKAPSGRPV